MQDLKLARDAVNRISEVAAMLQTTIDQKQAWLDEYKVTSADDPRWDVDFGGRRVLINMLQMNIDELGRIREHLLAP